MASVSENVTGSDGNTLIPAGTPVRLTITRLTPAKSKGSQGALSLRVEGVALNGGLQPVKATVQPVIPRIAGPGVSGSDAAKVGVGAAGGAVLGRSGWRATPRARLLGRHWRGRGAVSLRRPDQRCCGQGQDPRDAGPDRPAGRALRPALYQRVVEPDSSTRCFSRSDPHRSWLRLDSPRPYAWPRFP